MTRSQLTRAGIFLLLGGILLVILDRVSRQYPARGWDEILLERLDTARTEPESIEILVVGNSHAGAIDADEAGTGALVFPFPWNDLADVDYQVRNLAAELPALRLVVITVSYFTFHWSNDESDEDGLLDSRRTFHAITPSWRPVEHDLASLIRGKSSWIVRRDDWYQVISGLLGGGPAEDEDEDESHLEETRSDSFLVAHAEERVARTLERKDVMIERNPDLPEENYRRISALIDHLHSAGVRVVLFTPPFHYRYIELYREANPPREMESSVRRLAAEQGIEWLDYSDHPMAEEARWFLDSDHLNADGRQRFTRMFLDEVGARGKLVESPLDARDAPDAGDAGDGGP